ncbi:MAG: ABC transporter ATP-binding protein [Solirubrobacteraceae bacterium]
MSATAIEVAGLHKTFHVPRLATHTLKERALHPFHRGREDHLPALRDISFEVGSGEFFGIVGRNGSGKSTLLKLLAGIYAADGGTIRLAGRLAPFIELGVGFNPDLAARDNVILNAVMMGLSPRQARERFDGIIAFAELEDYLDLKLKNYSSGMQVRLAFAVMVQSDADVLLIDEVLAVGDAAFQQKCLDAFYSLRDEGRTIVLVTHEMDTVKRFCHRAMLLESGRVEAIGDPETVAHRYLELNFEDRGASEPAQPRGDAAVLEELRILDPDGADTRAVAHGAALRVEATLELRAALSGCWATIWVDNEDGIRVFGASRRVGELAAGERLRLVLRAENPLHSGHYYVGWSLERGVGSGNFATFAPRAGDVVVYGGDHIGGLVAVERELEVERVAAAREVAR